MGYRLWVIGLAALLLTACQQGRQYWSGETEPQQMEIVRFDKALLNVQAQTVEQDIRNLYANYPEFMPLWVENILGIPSQDTAFLVQQLPLFLEDTLYGFKQTNAKEKELFADTDDLQQSINKAFTRIRSIYPNWEFPTLYLFISGFQTPIYMEDELIAIGADMYLGSDYPYYNYVVYDYQKQTMRKECIPVDVVSAYLFRNISFTSGQNRLLDQMIYRGKIMYLTAQIFDDLPGYEVMGWTKEQWDWCVVNEEAIWHHMMDQRDLFKTEHLVISNYLNDAPFTSEVSQESPGRLGIWMGWRIVESYMEHNEEVTLQELMAEPDAQKILEQSQYRP